MKMLLSVVGLVAVAAMAFWLGRQWEDLPFNVPDRITVDADTARVYALACVYKDRAGTPQPVYDDPKPEIRDWLAEHGYEFVLFKIGPQMLREPLPCTTRGHDGKMNYGELTYWR